VVLFLLAEILSSLLSKRNILDEDKGLPYECGFEPFGIRNNLIFGISYILIAILFLIFDIEIMFILPWVLCVSSFGFFQ